MNDRVSILSAVNNALAPLKERSPLPDWDVSLPISVEMSGKSDIPAHFIQKLRACNGVFFENTTEMAALLKQENALHGYCDPQYVERFRNDPTFAGIQFSTTLDSAKIDDYAFGITRASMGIAESGTIVLKDADTSDRLGALAPWIHVALLNPSTIEATLLDSILKHGSDPSVIWVTGPSKTADVEGILIQGVHGPGIQGCLFM